MTETGIWSQQEADKYHQSSPKLAEWLVNNLLEHLPVYDFGCGNGYYLGQLEKAGYYCVGFEGTKLNNFLCKNVRIADLTKFIHVEPRGTVISLEVAEHLPIWAEQIFLNTITNACEKDLILSWALPNQPGVGHVNCRPKDYVISELDKRGFKFAEFATEEARLNIDDNTDWFRRTLLLFTRK